MLHIGALVFVGQRSPDMVLAQFDPGLGDQLGARLQPGHVGT